MIWNQWSNEVAEERRKIRETAPNALAFHRPTNYKQQALRELAHRLELEDEIFELKNKLSNYIDLLDGVTPEDMTRLNGMDIQYNQKLMNKI